MRKTKKWTGCALAAAVIACGSMAAPAMAADITTADTRNTTVNYSQESSYMVTIPGSVTLSGTGTADLTVSASTMNIAPDKRLEVKLTGGISSAGKVTLSEAADGNVQVTSLVQLGNAAVTADTVVAEFKNLSTTPTAGGTLTLGAPQPTASGQTEVQAGTYTGTLTFSIGTAADAAVTEG